jgi:Protein of unknown function (DUF3048) N-terminal domain/Protein of unknown function (DUF3048) C-terminal domain
MKFAGLISALILVLAACTSSGETGDSTTTTAPAPLTTLAPVTTTTVPPTTTTVPPTTTTITVPAIDVSESINGLLAKDELIDRRVVAVKVDNHQLARPQIALNEADAVYEALVEGGITRFIALYQTADFEKVGPNRSGRVTDSDLIKGLDATFQISGAQQWVKNIFRADGINVLYDTGATTFRDNSRPAPHNLFTSTIKIRKTADGRGWSDKNPGNMFLFGDAPGSGVAATDISMSFSSGPNSNWEWDGEHYLRSNGSVPHQTINIDGEREQVSADVLVALKVREYIARNPAGSGTPLPTADAVGTGEAIVFYDGEVVGGTWTREKNTDMFTLTNEDGTAMVIPPGRLWISLIPRSEPVTWKK